MAEPTSSNYPSSLDTTTTLGGDAVNFKQLTLDAGINSAVTTVSVAESITAINVPCYILIDSELIWAEAKSAGDFTSCVRGAGGTTAASHSNAAVVYVTYAANLFNMLKRAIIAIETELGTNPSGASVDLTTRLALLATLASPTFTGTVILPNTTKIQDTSSNNQYVLAVNELTADRTVTLPLLTGNDTFVFADFVQTLTNKRVTRRKTSETSSATPTINTDNTDCHQITALAVAITSFTTNLSGTPTDGQELDIEILDNGTARAITWGTSFASTSSGTLPTTTTLSKWLYVKLRYSSSRSKWLCLAVANES